jgi:hypothetical protein
MAFVDKGNDVRDSIITLTVFARLFGDAANLNDNCELRRTFLNLSWGPSPDPISDDTAK